MNRILEAGKDGVLLIELNRNRGTYICLDDSDNSWFTAREEMFDALEFDVKDTGAVYQYETLIKLLYDFKTGYIQTRIDDIIQDRE